MMRTPLLADGWKSRGVSPDHGKALLEKKEVNE